MRNWRRRGSGGESPPVTPASPVDRAEAVISPEGAKEAERAIRDQILAKHQVHDLQEDIHAWIEFLREAREENHFAEGIVAMVREGK